MLDQCSISLRHEVPVNPEIFTNPHFLIHDFLHYSTASPRSKRRRVGEETETQTSGYFEIYADRALAVHTRQSELGGTRRLILIHEIGHNTGLDHHGYDEGIACVMTADTELDCLERLDEGTHRCCGACRRVVERKLAGSRGSA
jgi:hypothetical protein